MGTTLIPVLNPLELVGNERISCAFLAASVPPISATLSSSLTCFCVDANWAVAADKSLTTFSCLGFNSTNSRESACSWLLSDINFEFVDSKPATFPSLIFRASCSVDNLAIASVSFLASSSRSFVSVEICAFSSTISCVFSIRIFCTRATSAFKASFWSSAAARDS